MPFTLSIATNLYENPNITELCFEFIHFNKEELINLADGIQKARSLKELIIQNCDFTHKELEILTPAISKNSSLLLMDFSNNQLMKTSGLLIGKILSSHCEKRNEIVWMYSLRGEIPSENLSLKGYLFKII